MNSTNRRFRAWVLALVILLVSVNVIVGVVMAQGGHDIHWGYEGEEGPDHWADLDEGFALCGEGQAQSPIDITDAIALNLVDITFDYSETALNILNNGHTIQVNYDEGSSITYNENTYNLLQFHFHHPSEHTVNGEPAVMEMHLVHQAENGSLAVVGVMLVEGEDANADYATVFDNLPAEEGEPMEESELAVNAADLLPEVQTYFIYTGSLTTPPCSQGVRWLVLTEPIALSAEQFEAFAAIFDGNARPVQPLNMRDLLADNG